MSAQVVGDNLKSGITKACFYEPSIDRTHADMAKHYGTVIIPARPRKPRDKATVAYVRVLSDRSVVDDWRTAYRQFAEPVDLSPPDALR